MFGNYCKSECRRLFFLSYKVDKKSISEHLPDVVYHTMQNVLSADEHRNITRPGKSGIEQISRSEHGRAGIYGNDDGGVFASLRFTVMAYACSNSSSRVKSYFTSLSSKVIRINSRECSIVSIVPISPLNTPIPSEPSAFSQIRS